MERDVVSLEKTIKRAVSKTVAGMSGQCQTNQYHGTLPYKEL